MEFRHRPVMLEQCVKGLDIRPDGIYVDGTFRRRRSQRRYLPQSERERYSDRYRPGPRRLGRFIRKTQRIQMQKIFRPEQLLGYKASAE